MLNIESHVNGLFSSVSYRVGQILFDPGDEWAGFHGVKTVMLTHAHFDHIYGLNKVIELNPDVEVLTNEAGRQMLLDARKNLSYYHEDSFVISKPECIRVMDDNQEMESGGNMTVRAIFTPGHNPSCITWIVGDCLFTGDSYIPGIKTVTNLPGGNKRHAEESLAVIKNLADSKKIYPGHR
ncbi:MAG: MBL fold metallo-hydrolase [Bacteroides sp.]|nr:MBL fold metallo-hydrolase [Bacteroides sp.]